MLSKREQLEMLYQCEPLGFHPEAGHFENWANWEELENEELIVTCAHDHDGAGRRLQHRHVQVTPDGLDFLRDGPLADLDAEAASNPAGGGHGSIRVDDEERDPAPGIVGGEGFGG